jgi:hypothetical protein
MEKTVTLTNDQTYGYFKYPTTWSEVMKITNRVNRGKKLDPLFQQFSQPSSFTISWTSFQKDGQEESPIYTYPSGGFSNGNNFEFTQFEKDKDLLD